MTSTSTNENVQDKKIVVTIPEDLELTEAETSVLSKGLTFVAVNNMIDEYQVKADCEGELLSFGYALFTYKRLKNSCLTKDSTKNSALIHYRIINRK